jgi:hypothetical protein
MVKPPYGLIWWASKYTRFDSGGEVTAGAYVFKMNIFPPPEDELAK